VTSILCIACTVLSANCAYIICVICYIRYLFSEERGNGGTGKAEGKRGKDVPPRSVNPGYGAEQ